MENNYKKNKASETVAVVGAGFAVAGCGGMAGRALSNLLSELGIDVDPRILEAAGIGLGFGIGSSAVKRHQEKQAWQEKQRLTQEVIRKHQAKIDVLVAEINKAKEKNRRSADQITLLTDFLKNLGYSV